MTDLQDYIVRVVDEAPALGPEQRARLASILNPGTGGAGHLTRVRDPYRVSDDERARREREAKAKALREHIAELTACAICGVPEAGHRVQERDSVLGFHDWEPKDVP